jgi:hypothetical protein
MLIQIDRADHYHASELDQPKKLIDSQLLTIDAYIVYTDPWMQYHESNCEVTFPCMYSSGGASNQISSIFCLLCHHCE